MDNQQATSADTFIKGLWRDNPVFVQVLGMCPVLAVTNSAVNALTMGLATLFVLLMSNIMVSLLRNWIPKEVRIASFILIIATFVTLVDYVIQAISLDLHKNLGAFISLIVVNCLILGRAEAFASKHPPLSSVLDALGMGTGFTFALLCMGSIRELLGNGSVFGWALFADSYQPWVVMILPSGGFFTLGVLMLVINRINKRVALSNARSEA
ncbi:electron transport complex subunit RsxE [Aestuariibacter salexigens]|uniref:electron transport complex subunit RsxE n=1 Tax=Aestuariibacter salexigens TaxID=226010 RepID=UPI0003F87A54|nr:electron transport complex subunit E [Aestuariibacter salexigens]